MIIKTLEVLDSCHLSILAEDGRTGTFDVTPFLHLEAFEPLQQKEEFINISNGRYYIEWACGADLSADTIEAYLNTHHA